MITVFELFMLIIAIFLAIYYYLTSTFDFWKSRGVPGPWPRVLFGNMKEVTLKKISLTERIKKIYEEYNNEPLIGIFMNKTPVIIVRDLDLIKDVLVKDFTNFSERPMTTHEKTDPLTLHLVNLDTARWRPLRAKLSPVFTASKLKEMFPLVVECSEQLVKNIEEVAKTAEPVECYDLTVKYMTDVIGSCAFGINMGAMSNEQSEFRRMGKMMVGRDFKRVLRYAIRENLPQLYDLLGYVLPWSEYTKFFIKAISNTIKYRKENNIVRPDFVNILMELKDHSEKLDYELTDTLLAAQAYLFFVAGFESSSLTIVHTLYELAQHTEIQNKLRKEIMEHYANYGNSLKYENVKTMKYLNKVINEILRKYPLMPFLIRKAMSDYTFNGTKTTIPKGTHVYIPMHAIQTDPKLFPNPEVFDPERFEADKIVGRHIMSYLPFGHGPRNCIAKRFGIYQTKIGLITILKNFRVETCEKTMIPYEFNPKLQVISPKNGIYLKITKVES